MKPFTSHKTTTVLSFAAILLACLSFHDLQGQEIAGDLTGKTRIFQNEAPDGPYVPSPRDAHEKSNAYRFDAPGFTIRQVNVDLDGMNIVGDAANEPSIAFDPNDPSNLAIGWRQFDNVNNSFRQAGFGFSRDAGDTWIFPGAIDPGVFRSDPVMGCDKDGNFYYNSLTVSGDQYWCNVYKSEDGGETWGMGTYAQGGDKQWMAIDRSEGIGSGHIYEFWSPAASICEPHYFSRSVDGNLTYEECSNVPNDPYWGTTFVGPSGELWVTGSLWSGFMVARSSNAQEAGQEVAWDLVSNVFLDGEIIGFGGYECPNPNGLLGQTIVSMDTSGGPGNGNLYLLCSVDRNSTNDPCDVMFSRSTDGGITWDWPVRINDDPGNSAYQWFGTMSVAPDGRIDAIWLDTRDHPGTVISSLYYSCSLDQGLTWSQNVRLSDFFDPHVGWPNQDKMGDYFDMYSDESGAHLAWAATFNGEQDVYYSVITPDYVGTADIAVQSSGLMASAYPNPFSGQVNIQFSLAERSAVTLEIISPDGKVVATLINNSLLAGLHRQKFDAAGLESGIYAYRLKVNGQRQTANGKLILIR
jgi:hypothetical protein